MAQEAIFVSGRPIEYDKAPANLADSLQRYIENGIMPGSFLTAFLENDLMDAVGRADHINLHQFYEIAVFLYNYAPSQSYGSPEKVSAWAAARRKSTAA